MCVAFCRERGAAWKSLPELPTHPPRPHFSANYPTKCSSEKSQTPWGGEGIYKPSRFPWKRRLQAGREGSAGSARRSGDTLRGGCGGRARERSEPRAQLTLRPAFQRGAGAWPASACFSRTRFRLNRCPAERWPRNAQPLKWNRSHGEENGFVFTASGAAFLPRTSELAGVLGTNWHAHQRLGSRGQPVPGSNPLLPAAVCP